MMKFSTLVCLALVATCAFSIDPTAEQIVEEKIERIISYFKSMEPHQLHAELAQMGVGANVDVSGERPTHHPSKKAPHKSPSDSEYLPVVQMNGMGSFAATLDPLADVISADLDGAYVLNVAIGNNFFDEMMNSFLMTLGAQVDYFASVVQSDENLVNGFNAIGYSQGNLLIRGYIEKYNNPPVYNHISMHGPLYGVAGFPGCNMTNVYCDEFDSALAKYAYLSAVQNHLCQANYYREPMHLDEYYAGDLYLSAYNNEAGVVNDEYTANYESLENLVLVKAALDTMVWPNESEWYGFFEDGSQEVVMTMTETIWYQDNYFGLKTLDENNKISFYETDGDHLQFSYQFLLSLVNTYFK